MVRRVILFACLAALALGVPAGALAARPLHTAIVEPSLASSQPGEQGAVAFQHMRDAGATRAKLWLRWGTVKPVDCTETEWDRIASCPPPPLAIRCTPAAYDWRGFDKQVQRAAAAGLAPMITIFAAPRWAEGPGGQGKGARKPDPAAFGCFARATALRYNGTMVDASGQLLPPVRYWFAWNEPNRSYFLSPQYDENGVIVSADHYRAMLNEFAKNVRDVHPDNVVVAGGLAPFTKAGHPGPLAFMRRMLCMSKRLVPVCSEKSSFDVWSTHPYTSGGPTRQAYHPDDVSIGDLPEMGRLLRAAVRAGNVVHRQPKVEFWVGEFSWDTNGPDPRAVPIKLHARWTAEALYRMWRAGVTSVVWFQVRDGAFPKSHHQSGLWRCSEPAVCSPQHVSTDKPKLSFRAFKFPFVAFRQTSTRTFVWGRTPWGTPGKVVIERRRTLAWRTVATLATNDAGIFFKTLRLSTTARHSMRARLAGTTTVSLGFSLTRPPDRFVYPFGCGGGVPC